MQCPATPGREVNCDGEQLADDLYAIHYATSDISQRTAGTDYSSTAGTLTIPAGSTSGTFTVPVLGYTEPSNVTFAVTLSSPTHATLFSPTSDTVTIIEQPYRQALDCRPVGRLQRRRR